MASFRHGKSRKCRAIRSVLTVDNPRIDDLGTGTGAIDGKTLRPLGITGAKRTELRPDLPTIAEQGLAGYAVSSSTLLLAPAALPAPVMQRLNSVFREALQAYFQALEEKKK